MKSEEIDCDFDDSYDGKRTLEHAKKAIKMVDDSIEQLSEFMRKDPKPYVPSKVKRKWVGDGLVDMDVPNPLSKGEYEKAKEDIKEIRLQLKFMRKALSNSKAVLGMPQKKDIDDMEHKIKEDVDKLNKLCGDEKPRYGLINHRALFFSNTRFFL